MAITVSGTASSSAPTASKNIADIKKNLLRPALTSNYSVSIVLPPDLLKILGTNQEQLNLLCSEAVLPGSNLAVMQINNNFTGVTERHAHRRVFDDRINFTFYVNADNYLPIRVFEAWQSYIMNEDKGASPNDPNYTYRLRYPDRSKDKNGDSGYTATGLTVTKFERDHQQELIYQFIKSYPISISSMPVSYDTSGLLKCTVSMTYLRYVVIQTDQFNIGQLKEPIANETPIGDIAISSKVNEHNEYYSNSGDNTQNSTNSADFFDGSNPGPFGGAIA